MNIKALCSSATLLLLVFSNTSVYSFDGNFGPDSSENTNCESIGSCSPRVKWRKHWTKEDGSINNRIKKLENQYWDLVYAGKLKDGSVGRRKADNLLQKIRNLQEQEQNIPGDIYRATMDFREVLENI